MLHLLMLQKVSACKIQLNSSRSFYSTRFLLSPKIGSIKNDKIAMSACCSIFQPCPIYLFFPRLEHDTLGRARDEIRNIPNVSRSI